MANKLKIASISAEVAPFAKAGGQADVARSLPKALRRLGHEVIAIMPLHGFIDTDKHRLKMIAENVPIRIDKDNTQNVNFWQGELMDGLPIFFVDHAGYFGKYKFIYGSKNDNRRFLFFSLAALKLLTIIDFKPNIIHCHEWHTGLIPYFLKKRFQNNSFYKSTATLFTIHNLAFQMGQDWWTVPHDKKDFGHARLPIFSDKASISCINFAKRAILYADIINTVSEQYAQEILTKEFGQDLHRILLHRKDRLFGIINGIDYFDFNPATDPGLKVNYDFNTLNKKERNKLFLQKEFSLPQDATIPVIGIVSRITEQKGFDLIREIMEPLMTRDLQLIIVGNGERRYENFIRKVTKKYPKKIGSHLKFDTKKASQIYAGSDIFLMPSRFEPCGLGQLISLRYGSVPIVNAVGGLVDTITDYDPTTKKGTGFVFKAYDPRYLLMAIARAIENYKHVEAWSDLVKHGMQQSYSWEIPAKNYVKLYNLALRRVRQKV
ncbi:glycogen synthase [Patescibacteria group bacterium]|nr:glycogen synthase [Patescibacteria group bacterium]MBU1890570.1 glycogen synthase [Patescibacteria group bacterium]